MVPLLIFAALIMPIYIWYINYPVFSIGDLGIACSSFGLSCILLILFLRFFCRNKSILLVLNYSFWTLFWFALPLSRLIRDAAIFEILKHPSVLKYQWLILFLFCSISLLLLLLLAFKFEHYIKKTTSLLNTFSIIIFLIVVIKCFHVVACEFIAFKTKNENKDIILEDKIKPNVYHILLDAFPNQPAIKRIGGDLSQFYDKLKNLGFLVFPNSRSNYYSTEYSVYSMTSLNYIEGDESLLSRREACQLIQQSDLFKIFAKKSYDLKFFCSPKLIEEKYPSSHIVKNSNDSTAFDFLYTLICFTPLKHYFEYIFSNKFKQNLIASHKNTFKALAKIETESNTFAFAHIVCPHEPYVFGKSSGNSVFSGLALTADNANLLTVENINNLKDNIYGIADYAIEVLEELILRFENKKIQPIIVLHSDHSCLNSALQENSPLITMDTIYGNLLAIYIPKEWHEEANNLEFINLYRFLLNHLFGEKYLYLPQEQIYKGQKVKYWPPKVL